MFLSVLGGGALVSVSPLPWLDSVHGDELALVEFRVLWVGVSEGFLAVLGALGSGCVAAAGETRAECCEAWLYVADHAREGGHAGDHDTEGHFDNAGFLLVGGRLTVWWGGLTK